MDWINGFDITHLCVYNNNDLFIIANFDDLGGTNVKERTVYITRTGIILAVTLILQGLRLVLPLPPQAGMVLIGSLVNACLILAALKIGWKAAVLLALVTPVAAYVQGMLPFFPFIGPVALGNVVFVAVVFAGRNSYWQVLAGAALLKACTLYGTFYLLFSLVAFPTAVRHMILLVMSWPQIVTALLGGILAWAIGRRISVIDRAKQH